MSKVVEVSELRDGLHGGSYYFIVKDGKLTHVSRYALSERKGSDISQYYVDLDKIKGKTVIEFSSTNKGPFGKVWAFPVEDLPLKWNERRKRELPITIINEYELAHLELSERLFLSEWNKYYRPMLSYIRKEITEKRSKIWATDLVNIHILNDLKYPVSFLIPYSERSRSMSLRELTKEIHQAWIVIRILREFTSEPLKLLFKQSPYSPIVTIDNYAMWYEFDLNPHTMFEGIAWREKAPPELKEIYKRAEKVGKRLGLSSIPLRPDITFTYAKKPEEFMQKPAVKLIIECKNADHPSWEKDVERQIKPYIEIFQPEHMIIASLKPVPQYLKKALSSYNIDIIDNVYPGGSGELELVAYIRRILNINIKNLKLDFPSFAGISFQST
jgi:hypothetical protein